MEDKRTQTHFGKVEHGGVPQLTDEKWQSPQHWAGTPGLVPPDHVDDFNNADDHQNSWYNDDSEEDADGT